MMRNPKRRLALCAAVLLVAVLVSGCAPGGGDASQTESLAAPQPAEGAQRDSYDMRLALDAEAKTIGGSVTVKLTNTSDDTWTQLCFRDYIAAIGETFDKMSGADTGLESAFTGVSDAATGEQLAYARTDADQSVLFVDLNAPLASGTSMEVRFDYTARIPQDAFRYRYTAVNDGARTLFELANFYPILAIYADGAWQTTDPFFYEGECFYSKCADYTISLTAPEAYTVVSTGAERKGEAENGACTWTLEAENVRDMGVTVCDALAVAEEKAGEVQVRCYFFDNDAAKAQGAAMLETAVQSLQFYARSIGGYPYDTLDVVMTNDLIGAIEFPAYVRVGDYSTQMGNGADDYFAGLVAENTAHEVAHQWFYAVVGNNGYREPWLDESLASFCALMVQGECLPEKEFEALVGAGKAALTHEDIKLNQSYAEFGKDYLGAVYENGKYFLFDLMQAMGEEAFYGALREYYSENAFQEATTADFVRAVYAHADNTAVRELMKARLGA